MSLLHRILACVILAANQSFAALNEREIMATRTSPEITSSPSAKEAPHQVITPSNEIPSVNKLFVFIPGTKGTPSQYRYILRTGASRGYHAIGINYPNDQAMGVLCKDVPSETSDCYWDARREVLTGMDYSSLVSVSVADSLINRLEKLILYLDGQYPTEGWGYYLASDGHVNWTLVILAGHSQGGGHVGVMTKMVSLHRAVYFSSPEDWVGGKDKPANWTSRPTVTPSSQQYGFAHLRDSLVSFAHATTIWYNFGVFLPPEGVVSVDSSVYPFSYSHQLETDSEPNPFSTALTMSLKIHGVTIVDISTPVDSSGNPLFDAVWGYLCFSPAESSTSNSTTPSTDPSFPSTDPSSTTNSSASNSNNNTNSSDPSFNNSSPNGSVSNTSTTNNSTNNTSSAPSSTNSSTNNSSKAPNTSTNISSEQQQIPVYLYSKISVNMINIYFVCFILTVGFIIQ